MGVGPDSKVAVHLPNLPQTVIAVSAILRLGAPSVMTNPLYVGREIEHQWNDAGCETAITANFLYERLLKNRRDSLPIRNYIIASIPEYLRFPLKQLAPLQTRTRPIFMLRRWSFRYWVMTLSNTLKNKSTLTMRS